MAIYLYTGSLKGAIKAFHENSSEVHPLLNIDKIYCKIDKIDFFKINKHEIICIESILK